ncbi:unnamed protein product [Blepharisma stoltei]|uniref:Uncharacterized protein n=1 Tax=Blepharisma stoltei TaxID=1481888 RepID=A0AAU9JE56_9CILI|nr:unnamed protein product [Blepharisma stoltei]
MNLIALICLRTCRCFGYHSKDAVQQDIDTKEPAHAENNLSDSLSSIRAEIGSNGIPVEKEKYYDKVGGVLVLKEEPRRNSLVNRKDSKESKYVLERRNTFPSSEKILITRLTLLNLCKE